MTIARGSKALGSPAIAVHTNKATLRRGYLDRVQPVLSTVLKYTARTSDFGYIEVEEGRKGPAIQRAAETDCELMHVLLEISGTGET